ncbi:hypothetical protein NC652_026297 [Populus alba x Populus x berolinensis]|nr:hypothetical protein NC652_026297 [Populus alba x Populus x berolinensis]
MQDKGVEPDLVAFIFSSVVLCHQAFSSNIANFGGRKFWRFCVDNIPSSHFNQDIDRRENLLICQMTGSLPNLMVKDSCC